MILHPRWSALGRACVIIKRRADTDHDRLNPVSMLSHPSFLLGTAKAHPHGSRSRCIDRRDYLGILVQRQRPKRWGNRACNLQRRETLKQRRPQSLHCLRRSPVQEHALTAQRRLFAVFEHQIRSINALLVQIPQAPQHPRDRRAIRCREIRFVDDALKPGILCRRDDRMNVADAYISTFMPARPTVDGLQYLGPADDVDRCFEHSLETSSELALECRILRRHEACAQTQRALRLDK